MKRTLFLTAVILALTFSAVAQNAPKAEVFGGYTFTHLKFSQTATDDEFKFNANGGAGGVAFYPAKSFGIVGEFGGSKISNINFSGTDVSVSGTFVSYLFGPRVRFATKAITPFAQALFGGIHVGDITSSDIRLCGAPGTCTINNDSSNNSFALTAEGGIDVNIAKHLAVRGQGGYLMTRFEQGQGNGVQSRERQNGARVFVGIVIH